MKKERPRIVLEHGVWRVRINRWRMSAEHIRDARRYVDRRNRLEFRGKYSVLGIARARHMFMQTVVKPLLREKECHS